RQQFEYLGELRALVEVADQMDAIRALRREVAGATGGVVTKQAKQANQAKRGQREAAAPAPYRRISLGDGYEALVGSSAAGNAAVTFEQAQPDDLWFHARAVP